MESGSRQLKFQEAQEQLRAAFSRFGQGIRVSVAVDRETGRTLEFLFVGMDADDAEWAISQLDGTEPQQLPDRPQAHLAPREADTVDLDGLVTVTARAIEVFGTREKAMSWLRAPLPALSDRTPLSMLNTTDGIEHIEDVLGRIEQGVW